MRTLQFILALALACVILVMIVVTAPYVAMKVAWTVVTGEGTNETRGSD